MKMIVIEEKRVFSMQSKLPLIDPKDKGKEILVEPTEKKSNFQAGINAVMIQVDINVKEIMSKFDTSVDFRIVENLIVQ